MGVKIKTNLFAMYKVIGDVNKAFQKEVSSGALGKELISATTNLIKKGISPVEGKGRFQKYSKSYTEDIKAGYVKDKDSPRPVNLTQTGDMLASLEVKTISGKPYLTMSDKKSAWHNKGGGKLPQRQMLPTEKGELFTQRIQQIIIKALKSAAKKRK
jgi:hypothetical protein